MNTTSRTETLPAHGIGEQLPAAPTFVAEEQQPDWPLHSLFRHNSTAEVVSNPTIMIVDDELVNIKVAEKCLKSQGYRNFLTTMDPTEALGMIDVQQPDILLLDIMMPEVSGLEILKQLRADKRFLDLPVVIVTAATDANTKMAALELGATEFLTKPIEPAELLVRVRNVLVAKSYHEEIKRYAWQLELDAPIQMAESRAAQLEIAFTTARAIEGRAGMKDEHVPCVARVARLVAAKLGLDEVLVDLIEQAAALHDIGKTGVSDAVLRTPQVLSSELRRPGQGFVIPKDPLLQRQCRELRSHTEIGATLLAQSKLPALQVAARIALGHHESWDGQGYPHGLAGEAIPIEARIVAVADCLDILRTGRGSSSETTLQWALQTIEQGSSTCFDPAVVNALTAAKTQVRTIWEEFPGERL